MPEDASRDLTTYLTQIMAEKAVSVHELSEASGLSEHTVTQILRGVQQPATDAARALARALDVPYAELAAVAEAAARNQRG
jgi:transcriptional regulator with XRE-family HTH domain